MNSQYITKATIDDGVSYQINHPKFSARITELGGQLISFTPQGKADVLWLSDSCPLDGSKPIRGGAPICWPWFGPASGLYAGEPQHGYARSVNWKLEHFEESEHAVELVLSPQLPKTLADSLGLSLKMRYVFTDNVEIELITKNTSTTPQKLSQAIHTYFAVDNIDDSQIIGLDEISYIDKLSHDRKTKQNGPVIINKHTDRIYLTAQDKVSLLNSNRKLDIVGEGHDSVVIWNPWQQNAKNMTDFDDLGYKKMVCVEMANTQGLVLEVNSCHSLKQKITLVSL
ncbi:D-hexose-6-phosphate mutarotase [Psychrosphaera saromensis]|uniref:Putative glucose-6-phosphate 1-epimerase n=1 Tax=Psychrosphaera saromensis TaxID=716813 RepID=A0A2S7UWK9_9GAMM|nr:D-hexose-6-phosphate mutarotase [Psychrosphaera saromensis]PQJ54159.1 hypothetical protein BTO11_11200 [Psychrosphaera saromensis]GHB75485.1 D-hexose-6-phosphate mutarotase [Psychrosphaera saromensis]GLQ12748.1 D-hexose-6-phosphate mutarotase [Psychrosphaera saromensis]